MIGKISLVMWLHFNQSYSKNLSMWDIRGFITPPTVKQKHYAFVGGSRWIWSFKYTSVVLFSSEPHPSENSTMEETSESLKNGIRGHKCAIRMIIRVTVIQMTIFWPVCMQISITKGNLNCAIQMTVRSFFFQWRISQIMQWNHSMNALTSNLWCGGWSYVIS